MAGYATRVLLVPSSVFLAALFGGAYGSGREVVEFISRHGPKGGLVAIATTATVYGVCLFLTFELARVARAFELRSFSQRLLGRFRFLYEALVAVGLLLALAICASAGGAIGTSHFGTPELAGRCRRAADHHGARLLRPGDRRAVDGPLRVRPRAGVGGLGRRRVLGGGR